MVWLKNNVLKVISLIILFIILVMELIYWASFKTKENTGNITNLAVKENAEKQQEEKKEEVVAVEIKGQVKKPGIYKLNSNATINDVITAAGNLLKDGFVDNINLSQKIQEQMVIYIFKKDEYNKVKRNDSYDICYIKSFDISNCLKNGYSVIVTSQDEEETSFSSQEVSSNSTSSSNSKNTQIVNINTADKNELMTLSGIGEAKALAIIEYRKANDGFKTIDEIKNVKGIGEAIYAKIKNYLKV